MVNMEEKEFYSYYLPALEKALMQDHINEGYRVRGPSFFIEGSRNKRLLIDNYVDKMSGVDKFLDKVGIYFDAISHYFDEIDGVEIEGFKRVILEELKEKRTSLN